MDAPQIPLFESVSSFDRKSLASRLQKLKDCKIFLGASSWRYEGWIGTVYTPERYITRGKFSKQKFHEECIQEYAETFPTICGDFSFYSMPEPLFWKRLFTSAPAHLKWSLKVPEEFTAKRFSQQARYGPRRGQPNPAFLDAGLFEAGFLEPLAPYLDRIAVLIIEFGTFSKSSYPLPAAFFDDLNGFLASLPRQVRYSVEIRNEEFLDARYFQILRDNGVAHTFTSWTRMPSLRQQLLIDEAATAPFTVARALLRPGRAYDQAVTLFSPYREVKEQYPEAREALRELIGRSIEREIEAHIYVNNRLEGNAIETIAGSITDA